MSKLFISLGFLLIFLGIIFYYFEENLKWLGNLPGDLRIDKENFKIFIPFTSMILISILLTIIVNFFKRFLK